MLHQKLQKREAEASKPRKYKTGEADAIVNRAIDAIMAHSDRVVDSSNINFDRKRNVLAATVLKGMQSI